MDFINKPYCRLKARKSKHGFKAVIVPQTMPAVGRSLEQLVGEFPAKLYTISDSNWGGSMSITIHTDDDQVATFIQNQFCAE